jgi:pimeloyl-ACP methyl ester carboxylesterase
MKFYIYLFLLIFCSSCLQSFQMSNKNIEEYFTKNHPLPIFAFSDTLNRKIFYASSTDTTKPVLLLIHGAPGAWFGYKEFFHDSLLLKKYTIIAPDRAGYNKSGDKETSIQEQANLLKPLLNIHYHQKVSILGRSYGAGIAAKLVADCPERVEKLILIAPACDPIKEKFWWFSKPVNSKFVRFFLPKYANRASDEKFVHIKELQKLLPEWQKIKCPVTILQGEKDWIIEPSNGSFVDSVLKNSPRRFIFLPQNGHLLTAERYDLIRGILLEK